jgi:streptomycin 6-kinase
MDDLSTAPLWPASFLRHNAEDPDYVQALPALITRMAERWSLCVEPLFAVIRFNYVAPASRSDGTRCVLKLSRFVDETRNEIAALQLWDGDGAARLLEVEPDLGALVLERLEPGTLLTQVAHTDDDAATLIAAGVVRQLWRSVPASHGLRSLDSWCDAYQRNRAAFTDHPSDLPSALFHRADDLRRDLLASTGEPSVLHGDLHHYNILRAERAAWLAIDPKGLVGDRCFDVCQFLRNPRHMTTAVSRRRLDILCSELGLDRQRTKAWCLVHAVLDLCWEFEDNGDWQPKAAYAQETLDF